jgi:hypothetical protein
MHFSILTAAFSVGSVADVGVETGAAVCALGTGGGRRVDGRRRRSGLWAFVGAVGAMSVLRVRIVPRS